MTIEAVREVTIKASPSTIFPFLVDESKFVQWMGTEATLEPTKGGEFRALCGGVNPAVGRFVEVIPNERVVFTFGWDVPDHPIPAGSSEVEITLTPRGGGTLVRLVHRGLPDDAVADHNAGWDYYLNRLSTAATGGDPGPDDPSLHDRATPAIEAS
jgi:uncharacterized protein YndB with AHSA1/START domain